MQKYLKLALLGALFYLPAVGVGCLCQSMLAPYIEGLFFWGFMSLANVVFFRDYKGNYFLQNCGVWLPALLVGLAVGVQGNYFSLVGVVVILLTVLFSWVMDKIYSKSKSAT